MMMNFFGRNKNKLQQRQLKQKDSDEDGGSSSKTAVDIENSGGQNQQVIDDSFEVKQQQSNGSKMQKRVKSGSKMVYIVLALAAVSFGFATYVLLTVAKEQEFQSEVSPKRMAKSLSLAGLKYVLILSLSLSLSLSTYSVDKLSHLRSFQVMHVKQQIWQKIMR